MILRLERVKLENNFKPRLVSDQDRPKIFHIDIRSVDNGYIATFSFPGGAKTLITSKLTELAEWLIEWDRDNQHE